MDTQGKRLRLLYPDLHGLERGKYLFGEVAEAGVAAFCVGVYPLTHDKEILAVPRTQFDVGLHDVEATLDRDSAAAGLGREHARRDRRRRVAGRARALGLTPRPACRRSTVASRWAWSRRWRSSSSSTCSNRTAGGWRPVAVPSHRVYGTGMSSTPRGRSTTIVNAAIDAGSRSRAGAASTTTPRTR